MAPIIHFYQGASMKIFQLPFSAQASFVSGLTAKKVSSAIHDYLKSRLSQACDLHDVAEKEKITGGNILLNHAINSEGTPVILFTLDKAIVGALQFVPMKVSGLEQCIEARGAGFFFGIRSIRHAIAATEELLCSVENIEGRASEWKRPAASITKRKIDRLVSDMSVLRALVAADPDQKPEERLRAVGNFVRDYASETVDAILDE
jgi:hypothetical protein